MRTIEEIIMGLNCHLHVCDGCPYEDVSGTVYACIGAIYNDCKEVLPELFEQNERLKIKLAEKDDGHGDYWDNICKLNARQENKGKNKYGVSLEENTTLTRKQRIEHLEEELIDGLKYCEHLKAIDDDGITANDYQRAAMRTAGDDKESYLLNGVMGLCGEAGEVIDLVKKHLHQGHDLDKEALILECGDCAWYLALIMSAIDYKVGDMLVKNIRKLEERYPEGFSKDRSIHREENNG